MRNYISVSIGFLLFMAMGNNLAAQAPPKPRDSTIVGPQTFALIMGISSYKFIRPLDYADKDAEMFRDYLKSPAGGKVTDDNIFCLLNDQALSTVFWSKGFKWLQAKKLQKGDRLFIYLAGHGDAIDEDQFFYLAYDCNPAGDKNNYLAGGVIQLFNLKKKIANETAKGVEVYFIMDACRSSELPGGTDGQNFLNAAISEKRAGEIIMLATGAGQESLEHVSIGNGHGLFTYYLVDGLTGMADSAGEVDNRITLGEIQKYVDDNVPSIAQQRFKRKQDPFFCCNENTDKTISIVDTAYFKRWLISKKSRGGGNSFNGLITRGSFYADTVLLETYHRFYNAVKESRLTGRNSAEEYYLMMERKFPGNSYTADAQSTLAVEYINFAQSKINLYLECKDAASVQKIRAQIDEDEKTDEINNSLDRMDKVARQEFYEVGNMLEKAIGYIRPDDPDFAKSLEGRMYFFKARGYFGRARKLVDIKDAFQYAYTAYASDKSAAYILHTLASLHVDNNRIDSAIHYARKAISAAPKWRYPYVTLAFSYKMLNRPDSAIKYYRKAVEVDPGNADAFVDLGHFYYSQSRKDSAVANYQRALRIEPNNIYASNNIAWVFHERKEYDEAIRYFKRSIAYDKRFINAYNGLGKTFYAKGQYDSARIYYEKAFDHYQDKSIVNVYIGNFYKNLKQYDSAKVYYRMAAALDPNYDQAFNDLGGVSFEQKQFDSAQFYFRKALQVNPYSAFSMINMGLVFKQLKQADSTYSYFQQAVRLEPTNPSILNNLGVIYGQENNVDSAKNYFRRALRVRPDYKPASNNLMKVFRDLNQLDSITQLLKMSSLADPESSLFMKDMGLAFLDQKRFDSARFYFRRAMRQDPGNPELFNHMGLTLQGLKQYDSARFYLQRADRLDPENPGIWINLSSVFRNLKQSDSAAFYYKKQLFQRAGTTPVALQTIGTFYSDLKEYDSAVVYYRMALELDSRYLPALNNGGIAFMEMDQHDSAFRYFRKAVLIDPNYQNASLNLGKLYHKLGRYDSAIVHIQNAIRLDPTKGKNYYDLACSYALHDKPQEAIAYLRQAFERGYKNYENLTTDPDLIGLKKYKEFIDLLDKYLPDRKDK